MDDPIWQVGPPGQLRELFCPEDDVSITVERFGGIHQNLSGARTMDITGLRQTITMNWEHLDGDDYEWLRALNLRQLPGPYRMISPLVKNRLSPEASLCKVGSGTRRGWIPDKGVGIRSFDYPSAVNAQLTLSQSTMWSNRLAGYAGRWDSKNLVTVFPGELVNFSAYFKGTGAIASVHFGIDWFDKTKTQITPSADEINAITTSWARWDITATVPANAVMARPYIYTSDITQDILLAAAQFEQGSVPTSWVLGGGAPVVLLDQLTDTSPIYGYNTLSATFLEA